MNPTTARIISIESLHKKLLETLREVEGSGHELIVTNNGHPAWKIVPIPPIKKGRTIEEVFGHLRGKVVYHEDINTPTIDEWDDV